jgi:phage gpG-like protein
MGQSNARHTRCRRLRRIGGINATGLRRNAENCSCGGSGTMSMKWNGDALRARAARMTREGLMRCAILAQTEIRAELSRQKTTRDTRTQSAPGQPPGMLTGTLARSIAIDASNIDQPIPSVRVGTNLIYAAVHEFGRPIRAKNVRNLTVPLNNEARAMRRRYASLKDVPGLRVWPGGRVLGRFVGPRNKKRWQGLFLLVPMIQMPMRPFMRPGFTRASERFGAIWRAVFSGIGGRR